MDIKNEHEVTEDIKIDIYYPDHAPRTESALFERTKHHLVHELDTPCYVCGSKDNREVHHFFVEWAYANAVDWDIMHKLHPDFHWDTFKTPEDFIDDPYNMMILCAKHHREKDHGIHMLPYPIWVVQKVLRADFVQMPDELKTV